MCAPSPTRPARASQVATPTLSLQLVWTVQRLHQPTAVRLSPAERSELTQLFLRGYEAMRDDARLRRLEERVAEYNALLRAHGLKDYQVESTSLNSARALALLAFRIAKLVGFGSIALPGETNAVDTLHPARAAAHAAAACPGLVLNLPVIIISRYISARKQAEALCGSNVKVAARDVLASWKVLIALVLGAIPRTAFPRLSPPFPASSARPYPPLRRRQCR